LTEIYIPLTGAFKFIHPANKPCPDPHEKTMDFFLKHKNAPHGMIVTNSPNYKEPTLYLTSPQTLNEFYIKEIEHYTRVGHPPSAFDDMFFLKGGRLGAR
jgi:hypothetical protein